MSLYLRSGHPRKWWPAIFVLRWHERAGPQGPEVVSFGGLGLRLGRWKTVVLERQPALWRSIT